MKYLNDNSSVTQEELLDNYKAAFAVYDAAHTAHAATTTYAADFTVTSAASAAANTAAYASADVANTYVKKKVDRYFGHTGENKQDYIDEIAKNKRDK